MVVGPGMVGGGGEIRDCQVLLLFFFFSPQTQSSLSLSVSVYLLLPLAFSRGGLCQILLPSPPTPSRRKERRETKKWPFDGTKMWLGASHVGTSTAVRQRGGCFDCRCSMYYPGWVFVENVSFVVAGSVVVKYSLF